MKKIHVVGIILIAIGMAVVMGLVINTDNYVGFEEASDRAGEKVTVIGKLEKDKEIINAPNSLTFYLKDDEGVVKKVVLNEPMPEGFKRSESVTVTGKMEGDVFRASYMLMKCPSKYKKEEAQAGSK